MGANDVVMYTTNWCGYCERARRVFASRNVPIREVDVEASPENRAEMQNRSGRRSVPQIFIGELHVGGSDDLLAMEASGKLDGLLGR
jgi:glutaredoxin 3